MTQVIKTILILQEYDERSTPSSISLAKRLQVGLLLVSCSVRPLHWCIILERKLSKSFFQGDTVHVFFIDNGKNIDELFISFNLKFVSEKDFEILSSS